MAAYIVYCAETPGCPQAVMAGTAAMGYAIWNATTSSVGSIWDWVFANEECPPKLPAGTKPINETPWSGDHEEIKEGVGNGPRDSTWIDRDDNVWTENSDGTYTNHGPAGAFTGSGKPSGQKGRDRERGRTRE